jgi:phage baseplate assembly protein W
MGTYQAPVGYHKRNCTWPLRAGGAGWITARLLDRYDAAVYHFARVPLGTLYADSEYGTEFWRLRTQTLTDEEAQLQQAAVASGFRRYMPDLSLVNLTFEKDSESERLYALITWKIRTAVDVLHGDLARPRTTAVLV